MAPLLRAFDPYRKLTGLCHRHGVSAFCMDSQETQGSGLAGFRNLGSGARTGKLEVSTFDACLVWAPNLCGFQAQNGNFSVVPQMAVPGKLRNLNPQSQQM